MPKKRKPTPKTKKQRAKIETVIGEFKEGELHSGSKEGPIVKSKKQALAIALSYSDVSKKKSKKKKKSTSKKK